jgi:molecular chaperone GrpE
MGRTADRKKRESEQDGLKPDNEEAGQDKHADGSHPVEKQDVPPENADARVSPQQASIPQPPPFPPPDDAGALRKLLDEETKLADEYLSKLRYLQAEFDNYKKWADRDKAEFTKVANEKLVRAILPVIDNLEKAIDAGRKEKTPFLDGIGMIYNEMIAALKSVGLREMKSVGLKFDPYRQEAMLTEARNDVEEGTVVEDLQKGYLLNDKVIRTAKVKIAKKSDEKNDKTDAADSGSTGPQNG